MLGEFKATFKDCLLMIPESVGLVFESVSVINPRAGLATPRTDGMQVCDILQSDGLPVTLYRRLPTPFPEPAWLWRRAGESVSCSHNQCRESRRWFHVYERAPRVLLYPPLATPLSTEQGSTSFNGGFENLRHIASYG